VYDTPSKLDVCFDSIKNYFLWVIWLVENWRDITNVLLRFQNTLDFGNTCSLHMILTQKRVNIWSFYWTCMREHFSRLNTKRTQHAWETDRNYHGRTTSKKSETINTKTPQRTTIFVHNLKIFLYVLCILCFSQYSLSKT
jgi:hypothetical protein